MRLFVGYAEERVEVGVGVFRVRLGCWVVSMCWTGTSTCSGWEFLTCVVGLTYLPMTLAVLRGGLVPIAAWLA